MQLTFRSLGEAEPGAKWQALFADTWPAFQRWFLSEGDEARPSYLASLRALRRHMPELVPSYERLCELAGGSDRAARFLSLYCPPPYLMGCSQAVWSGDEPLLVRNYDYNPHFVDGLVLHSRWNGRRVIAMSDCLWGAVDGMNEDGLAVSLTFGGRRVVGRGFGAPLVLRYLLETCATTAEAAEALRAMPVHMAYNLTAVDRSGRHMTAYLSPDRDALITSAAVATNHQERVEWHEHARATATVERERYLLRRLTLHDEPAPRFIGAFLKPPLYSTAFERGFGTLYTSVYWPLRGRVDLLWPGGRWSQTFDAFEDGKRTVTYGPTPRVTEPGLTGSSPTAPAAVTVGPA